MARKLNENKPGFTEFMIINITKSLFNKIKVSRS
jgi:hypothetical protein